MTRLNGVVALLLCPLALLNGQNGGGQRGHFVVDTSVACHSKPTLDSATSIAEPLGTEVRASQETRADGQTWYFDASSITGQNPSCWVYGPNTAALNILKPDRLLLAILDHILARKDAKLDEFVEVENYLKETADWPSASMSGLLRFRYLQLIDRAVGEIDPLRGVPPLERAWMFSHRDLLGYFEPDAAWFVKPEHYWNLFEANKNEPWAEELAWFASTLRTHTDECYSDCQLRQLRDRPLQYWTRYPAGPHIKDALRDGAEWARAAATGACEAGVPGVDPDALKEIRSSLAKVTDTGKGPILKSLEEIERKCSRK